MSQSTLSRELALRIGLASRALPDTRPIRLVHVLTDLCGLPLTESKLAALTLSRYKRALAGNYGTETLKKSLRLLQHGDAELERKATLGSRIQFYREGDMPKSIRVAVASDDGIHVDGQFSVCKQFYIFQVSAEETRLIAIRAAATAKPMKSEEKQHYRAEIIQDCQVFYNQSIGGAAASKVIKQGVHPITLNGNALITNILDQLQHVLSTSPPPWLAKSMGVARNPSNHSLEEKLT